MKKFTILIPFMMLFACNDDEQQSKEGTQQVVESTSQQQSHILSYIPADSPLLLTSGLNPELYPKRYIEVMQNNMEGAVKYIETMLNQALKAQQSSSQLTTTESGDDTPETVTPSADDMMKQKAMAFVDKWLVDGNMSKLGFKVGETQLAVYMIDLFPVLRMHLSDGNQIEAMLDELQSEFELNFTITDIDGIKVRELILDKLTLFVATQDDYLVLSGAPAVVKDQMVNQLIGAQKPQKSLAQDKSQLNQIKSTHGYITDDVMLFDFQTLADYFINPSKHNSVMVNFLQIEDNMLSQVCKDEITAMIAKAPRMVAGGTAFDDDTIDATFVWEMDQKIALDLQTLAGRIPHGNDDAAMAFGMSFDINNAKDLAQKYVNQLIESPYQCEHFIAMNQQADQLLAKLSQPLPPFIGNFKGFNFSLDELKLNMANADLANPNAKEMIESLKTQVFLAVDETQALLGMAQMMIPQLQGVEIKTDGSLITLADKMPMISGKDIPVDIKNLYAAISSDTIGFSMGHEGGGDLSTKVMDEGSNVLMSFSANVEGYKSLLEQIFSMADMPNMPEQVKEELQLQKELTLSMLYWKKQDATLSFTDKGFVTDFSIKY